MERLILPQLMTSAAIATHPIHTGPTLEELTHWDRDKMAAIFQTTFSIAFSWVKMYEFRIRFHWNWLLRVKLTIFQHWFRYWLGAYQVPSHYLNKWWLVYLHIYASLSLNEFTLPIFRREYLGWTRSFPCLLMPWLTWTAVDMILMM